VGEEIVRRERLNKYGIGEGWKRREREGGREEIVQRERERESERERDECCLRERMEFNKECTY
jgi:hypothetical protein